MDRLCDVTFNVGPLVKLILSKAHEVCSQQLDYSIQKHMVSQQLFKQQSSDHGWISGVVQHAFHSLDMKAEEFQMRIARFSVLPPISGPDRMLI